MGLASLTNLKTKNDNRMVAYAKTLATAEFGHKSDVVTKEPLALAA